MHPTGLIQATHRRVDNRVPGLAIAPGLEMRFILRPIYQAGFQLEGLVHAEPGIGHHQVTIKFAPDQFVEPGKALFTGTERQVTQLLLDRLQALRGG